jgi:formate dehydrogenase major subunit
LGLHRADQEGLWANIATPYVGDANVETPEFKAFLVDGESAAPSV